MSLGIDARTWVISDTHFGHKKIGQLGGGRPEGWQDRIIASWTRLVAPDDLLLHLGDVALLRAADPLLDVIAALPGRKVLIRGNHDTQTVTALKRLGFLHVFNKPIATEACGRLVVFSHRPLHDFKEEINVHGHIHTNGYAPSIIALDRDHRNVSIEIMDYEPVRLQEIIEGRHYQSPRNSPVGIEEVKAVEEVMAV